MSTRALEISRASTIPQTSIQPEESGGGASLPDFNRVEAVLTLLCGLFMVGGLLADARGAPALLHNALFVGAYITGGFFGTIGALKALTHRQIDVNFLMIVAALGAAVIDYWAEGAMLLFLFSLSNTLQAFALDRSRHAIRALMTLRPREARLQSPDGTERMIPIESLQLGDLLIVKPGERIPMDGRIIAGSSAIDQAAITGESMPVDKGAGDDIFAGTLNGQGALEIQVTHLAADTTLAKVIQLVEQAQTRKAATQRFLDEFGPRYAIGVLTTAGLLIIIPFFILGQPWNFVFYRAMTFLVVASPCALIISTPAAILSAIANGARNGILFKGGSYLEQAASITAVAFDKTGTLTRGKPQVTDVIAASDVLGSAWFDERFFAALDPHGPATPERCTADELLRLAASVERRSEHPLGDAIVAAAGKRELFLSDVSELRAVTGQGVFGTVEGNEIQIGNRRLFDQADEVWPEPLRRCARKLEAEGKTVVGVSRNHHPIGFIALADALRPEANATLDQLRSIGVKRIIMITGDARRVASAVARDLNIDEVHSDLLPEQKVEFLERLSKQSPAAMVGDGVNDAPAMAVSSLGVAMGAVGSDVALETADVVLMRDDLTRLPYMFNLSRRARRIVWQNIGFSLAVIATLILSVFIVQLPLPLGVVGHEGSTLLVVLNGLRLLKNPR